MLSVIKVAICVMIKHFSVAKLNSTVAFFFIYFMLPNYSVNILLLNIDKIVTVIFHWILLFLLQ